MTDSNYTHIALVADRSGSMASIDADMNGAIKEFFTAQGKEPGTLKVDITVFDDRADLVLTDGTVDQVVHPVIRPRGMTALNDALGLTIDRLGKRLSSLAEEDRPGKVIVLVVTDGGENSSREYTAERVKALVETQQNEYSWEFVFLGANIDAFTVGAQYGFAQGSTIQYVANAAGANSVIASASAYVTRTRSGLSTEFTEEERTASNLTV